MPAGGQGLAEFGGNDAAATVDRIARNADFHVVGGVKKETPGEVTDLPRFCHRICVPLQGTTQQGSGCTATES
jgi:hypothetical protein